MTKKFLILLAVVILFLTLFPFGWLGELSPAFDDLLTFLFPEPWGHFIGHGILFSLVGLAILLIVPEMRSRYWLYLPLVLVIAVGQESFQLLYKQRQVIINDVIDLIPDILGATLAFIQFAIRKQITVPVSPNEG